MNRTALLLLASMGVGPAHSKGTIDHQLPSPKDECLQFEAAVPEDPPGLEAIGLVESDGGKYLNHPLVTRGLNAGTRAGGAYAVMPLTFKDVVARHPDLRRCYGDLLNSPPDAITAQLNSDTAMSTVVAQAYYLELAVRLGDHYRVAHAWYHGPGRTVRLPAQRIRADEYVQDYARAYRQVITARRTAASPFPIRVARLEPVPVQLASPGFELPLFWQGSRRRSSI